MHRLLEQNLLRRIGAVAAVPVAAATAILVVALPSRAAYVEAQSFLNPSLTVTIGSPGYDASQADDSAVFQAAVDAVAAAGGGKVVAPAGQYSLRGVELRSDVHIVFDGASTVLPYTAGLAADASVSLFSMGMNSRTDNTSIRGINAPTELVFNGHDKLRGFIAADVTNFLISGFDIQDTKSTFSSVELTWDGENPDGSYKIPTSGTVEQIRTFNSAYGYGTIQAQAADSVLFRDIESTGGVALRLETGWKTMNKAQSGGLHNITAENITSHRGKAALMLGAHAMHNGDVVATQINSFGSEYAVTIEGGSLHKYTEAEILEHGLTEGTWQSIAIDGVNAVYQDGPIVTRWNHLLHYPEELHPLIYQAPPSDTQHSYRGPSIAPVNNPMQDDPTVTVTNIVSEGFLFHDDQIDSSDFFGGHWKSVIANGPVLPGDFNGDAVVDAADYTVWRDNLGATVAAFSQGDANGDELVDIRDYTVWKNNIGRTPESWTLAAVSAPEPGGAAVAAAVVIWGAARPRAQREPAGPQRAFPSRKTEP